MSIRLKFFLLAGVISLILASVSIIGYSTSATNLQDSLEKELQATVEIQGRSLNSWILEKTVPGINAANQMQYFINSDRNTIQNLMKLAENDRDIMAITNCDENGLVISNSADYTGKIEIRTRDWYKNVKSERKLIFTDVYEDATNGKSVVSAAIPYFDNTGNFFGAICVDIMIDTLNDEMRQINYRGQGTGMIIDKRGKIIASANNSQSMQDISSTDAFRNMSGKNNGFFTTDDGQIFAYTTVETTGWIAAIAVPESFVFASMHNLRITYIFLTLIMLLGIFVTVFFNVNFSNRIIKNIKDIKNLTVQLARGDLRVADLKVDSKDEFGELANAFNSMVHDVRKLIQTLSTTAEDVAMSSEKLSSIAQQSSESASHIADNAVKVAENVDNQMKSTSTAKKDVDEVFEYMNSVAEKSKTVAANTNLTADAAKTGETLMNDAMLKMSNIEKSFSDVAEMIDKLGTNSQQIGMIVEAISKIADQTNLLALNAAIEAARAGETGKGFAVVADEVRKLAISSRESVEKIKERIEEIQSDTQKAVESMKHETDEVKTGSNAMNEVNLQFAKIIQMVNQNKKQIDDISAAVNNLSNGVQKTVAVVDDIDENSQLTAGHIQTISASTQEQTASMQEIAASSRTLADIAKDLKNATNKFSV